MSGDKSPSAKQPPDAERQGECLGEEVFLHVRQSLMPIATVNVR